MARILSLAKRIEQNVNEPNRRTKEHMVNKHLTTKPRTDQTRDRFSNKLVLFSRAAVAYKFVCFFNHHHHHLVFLMKTFRRNELKSVFKFVYFLCSIMPRCSLFSANCLFRCWCSCCCCCCMYFNSHESIPLMFISCSHFD